MDMLEIQRALTSQGFNPGPVDGIFGRLTSGAIKDFQNRNGLPATGTPDDATVQQILAAAKAIASTGLVWMDEARRLMGTKEVAGKGSNKTIIDWATALGIDYPSDDIPWCGLFVAHCIGATLPGEPLPANPLGARNWQKFGNPTTPAEGAVLVFWRESKSGTKGHVGFYNGEDRVAYQVLGGNQSDAVNITRIAKDRLLEARWPKSAASLTGKVIQRTETGALSQNER